MLCNTAPTPIRSIAAFTTYYSIPHLKIAALVRWSVRAAGGRPFPFQHMFC